MRFFRFPTAMVRPLSSLAKFSFVISNMPFPSQTTSSTFSSQHSCDCEERFTFANPKTAYNGGPHAFRGSLLQDDEGWLFRLPNGSFRTADNSPGQGPENSLVA